VPVLFFGAFLFSTNFLFSKVFIYAKIVLMSLKKSEIIVPAIIAEIDAWLLLFVLKTIGFNLQDFLIKTNLEVFFTPLNIFLKFLPIILPFVAIFYVFIGSLFKNKSQGIFQFFKFTLVGSLNTFIDFGILNFLMFIFQITFGWGYSIFKAISFSSGVINSYFWNKFWTFQKTETKAGAGEFSKFYLVTFIGFLINVSIASFVVNVIGPQFGFSKVMWANIGAFIAVLCAFIWNFLSSKFFVFKK